MSTKSTPRDARGSEGAGYRAVHNREDARSGELLAFRVEK